MPSHTYVFLGEDVYTLDTHAEREHARAHMAAAGVTDLPIWTGGPEEDDDNDMSGDDFTLACPECGLVDGWEEGADGATFCECARCFICNGYPTHVEGCSEHAWPFSP